MLSNSFSNLIQPYPPHTTLSNLIHPSPNISNIIQPYPTLSNLIQPYPTLSNLIQPYPNHKYTMLDKPYLNVSNLIQPYPAIFNICQKKIFFFTFAYFFNFSNTQTSEISSLFNELVLKKWAMIKHCNPLPLL